MAAFAHVERTNVSRNMVTDDFQGDQENFQLIHEEQGGKIFASFLKKRNFSEHLIRFCCKQRQK